MNWNKKYGKYPCQDYLNNALRYLAADKVMNMDAMLEICHCLHKAGGEIYPDVLALIKLRCNDVSHNKED